MALSGGGDVNLLPKYISATRWSARWSAVNSLLSSYDVLRSVIRKISNNLQEKPTVRAEARGLLLSFNKLKTGIMTVFWNDILRAFDRVDKLLQGTEVDLQDVASYRSLASQSSRANIFNL